MRAPKADMCVCPMRTPSDTSAVARLFETGTVDPSTVVALVGKNEGTGLHDDFGRELADLKLREALGKAMGIDRDEVADCVSIILSGGCFGVISPHVTVITQTVVDVPENRIPP